MRNAKGERLSSGIVEMSVAIWSEKETSYKMRFPWSSSEKKMDFGACYSNINEYLNTNRLQVVLKEVVLQINKTFHQPGWTCTDAFAEGNIASKKAQMK